MKERAGVKQLRRGKNLETLTNPWVVDSSFSPYLFHGLSLRCLIPFLRVSFRFNTGDYRSRAPANCLPFRRTIVGEGTIRKSWLGWTLITATLNSRRSSRRKKKKRRVSTRLPPPSRDRPSRYNTIPCLFLVFECHELRVYTRHFKHSSWINRRFISGCVNKDRMESMRWMEAIVFFAMIPPGTVIFLSGDNKRNEKLNREARIGKLRQLGWISKSHTAQQLCN